MKRLVSGVKPTGTVHIGNYFGAMKRFVEMQDSYESFVFLADLHALTTARDPEALRKQTFELAAAYLAIGLDPKKTVLFKQSDVADHAELAWIFNCITPMPTLQRAHAYKDAVAKKKEINVGIFDYPVLMAADILLYQPDVVPVGKDQEQHVEIAREIAKRFNSTFGEAFKLPEPQVKEEVNVVPGIDGQKMSKSYNNVIPLFASGEETKEIVMKIVTDSRKPEEPKDKSDVLYALLRIFSEDMTAVDNAYENGGVGYKELKEMLADAINTSLSEIRDRYSELIKDPKKVHKILEDGAKKARAESEKTMKKVRELTGIR